MQDLAGYAAAATAYITTQFIDRPDTGPGLGDGIQSLYEVVRRRLDDDDHLGAEYVASSPHSIKARRTLAEDIEYGAGEHPGFAAELISRVDGLRDAGGLDYLAACGGLVVIRQVVDGDRRGDVFRTGLVRALGPAVLSALLAASVTAGGAGVAASNSPTVWQIVYYILGSLAIAGMATCFYAGMVGTSKSILLIGIAMALVFGTLVGILHRMPRLRGVSRDSV